MKASRTIPFVVMIGLTVLLGPAFADGETGKTGERKQSDDTEATGSAAPISDFMKATNANRKQKATPSYSNADLQRMFGAPSADPAPSSSGSTEPPETEGAKEAPKDPLTQLLEAQESEKERQSKAEAARQKVAVIEKRIVDLERRTLALRNPLLQRPSAPEDEAARDAWNAADTVGRLEQNAQQLDLAREALETARQELADLRF